MSVGAFLLTKENLDLVRRSSWKVGRPQIIEQGLRYFDAHPGDAERIAANLAHMGLQSGGAALDEVLREIAAHYYEKLFVLVKTYEAYWIAKNRIDFGDALAPYAEAAATGKAVFIGQSHFGATYLMGMALMVHGLDIHVVGNFPEPVGGLLQGSIDAVVGRWGTGRATLLNLAGGGVDVPLEMMRLLSGRKIVSNVYDENNKFCRPMELLGRRIMGGTGMDLILRNFTDDQVVVLTAFLVRTSDETFRYEVDRHYLAAGDIVASFFGSLERRIRSHPAQWYFLNELHHNFAA